MLGKYVRIKVTNPIGSKNENGFVYPLNYGMADSGKSNQKAFIMGIHHPVCNFDGRIIATLYSRAKNECIWIVAPKSTHFIINDIKQYLDFETDFKGYKLECLYEASCGAVIFKKFSGETKFLLIKNKRSAHWGFPKGHIENGETEKETAIREVFEETGLKIRIIDGFSTKSAYRIQGKIEKNVTIFLGEILGGSLVIQEEEIDAFVWHCYENALSLLRFENDKKTLLDAYAFLIENNKI